MQSGDLLLPPASFLVFPKAVPLYAGHLHLVLEQFTPIHVVKNLFFHKPFSTIAHLFLSLAVDCLSRLFPSKILYAFDFPIRAYLTQFLTVFGHYTSRNSSLYDFLHSLLLSALFSSEYVSRACLHCTVFLPHCERHVSEPLKTANIVVESLTSWRHGAIFLGQLLKLFSHPGILFLGLSPSVRKSC